MRVSLNQTPRNPALGDTGEGENNEHAAAHPQISDGKNPMLAKSDDPTIWLPLAQDRTAEATLVNANIFGHYKLVMATQSPHR
jgi:hypothetical protein